MLPPPKKKPTFKGLSRNDIIFWLLNKPDYSPKSPFVIFWLTPLSQVCSVMSSFTLNKARSLLLSPRSPFIIFWLTLPSPWKMSLIASPWICKWNVKNMWYSIHWSKGTLEALYLYMVHRQFASPTPLSPVFYGCKPPPPCLHEYCLHSTATYLKISVVRMSSRLQHNIRILDHC